MSYEIVGRKVISATSHKTLATNIANYLVEQIPELTIAYSYDSTSNTYTRTVALSWKETKAGFSLAGYHRYGSGNASDYSGFFVTKNITSSTYSNIHPNGNFTQHGYYYSQKNSTYYINVDVCIAKLTNGYVISFGGFGLYIGDYTSPIYGKCIVAINFNGTTVDAGGHTPALDPSAYYWGKVGFLIAGEVNVDDYYSPSYAYYNQNYYNYSAIFSEDGSECYFCSGVTITPSTNAPKDYTAILSPMYVAARDIWIEPILLTDIFYMTASNYPGLFEEAQIGDVTAYRMTNNGRIVVI